MANDLAGLDVKALKDLADLCIRQAQSKHDKVRNYASILHGGFGGAAGEILRREMERTEKERDRWLSIQETLLAHATEQAERANAQ